MNLTMKEIAKKINKSVSTARMYIDRSNFAHITNKKVGRTRVYFGVTEADISLLKSFVENRKKGLDAIYGTKAN